MKKRPSSHRVLPGPAAGARAPNGRHPPRPPSLQRINLYTERAAKVFERGYVRLSVLVRHYYRQRRLPYTSHEDPAVRKLHDMADEVRADLLRRYQALSRKQNVTWRPGGNRKSHDVDAIRVVPLDNAWLDLLIQFDCALADLYDLAEEGIVLSADVLTEFEKPIAGEILAIKTRAPYVLTPSDKQQPKNHRGSDRSTSHG